MSDIQIMNINIKTMSSDKKYKHTSSENEDRIKRSNKAFKAEELKCYEGKENNSEVETCVRACACACVCTD